MAWRPPRLARQPARPPAAHDCTVLTDESARKQMRCPATYVAQRCVETIEWGGWRSPPVHVARVPPRNVQAQSIRIRVHTRTCVDACTGWRGGCTASALPVTARATPHAAANTHAHTRACGVLCWRGVTRTNSFCHGITRTPATEGRRGDADSPALRCARGSRTVAVDGPAARCTSSGCVRRCQPSRGMRGGCPRHPALAACVTLAWSCGDACGRGTLARDPCTHSRCGRRPSGAVGRVRGGPRTGTRQ